MITSRRLLLRSAAGVGGTVLGAAMLSPSPASAAATTAAAQPGATLALNGVSGSVVLDLSQADTFTCTLTGETTFTFVNWPATTQDGHPVTTEPTVVARQDATGGHGMHFGNVTWLPEGSTPVFDTAANQVNVTAFLSVDAGTTVYGQGGWFEPSGGGFGVYGDGSDGDVVLDGTNTYPFLGKSHNATNNTDYYWLLRDVYLSSLAVVPGTVLQLAGGGTPAFRLFCAGTLNVAAGAQIVTYVNHEASGATGGSDTTGGSVSPGANGPNGSATNGAGAAGRGVLGQNGTGTDGGPAGNGGANASGAAGGAGGTAALPAGYSLPRALPWASMMAAYGPNVTGTTQFFPGGASGGAGAGDGTKTAGGGGAGGNPLFIAARTLVNNGAIVAQGGAGGNAAGGNAGGGGGGQGGPIMLISSGYAGTGVISSRGGKAGNGVGSGKNGAAGGASWTVLLEN
jgi:hypothetical protein